MAGSAATPLRGVNQATLSLVPAQQPERPQLNRYVRIPPNPAPFERSQTLWNVAWWFVVIAYTVSAIAVVIFVGLTSPTNLPLAMLGATLTLQKVGELTEYCARQAKEYADLARIERGIERCAALLPRVRGEVQIPRGRSTPYYGLAARYQFWSNEVERFTGLGTQALARDARNDLATQRANRLEAYSYGMDALKARVRAAYFDFLVRNPNRQEDFDDFVVFANGNTADCLIDSALNQVFNNGAQNPFLRTRNGESYSVREIEVMDDLSALFEGAPDRPNSEAGSLP